MIQATNINLDDGNDYLNYKDLLNDSNVKILMETYHTNKDGDAFCVIKYDKPMPDEETSSRDCAPFRI